MSCTVLFLTDEANSACVSIVSLSALLHCSERLGWIQNDGDFGTGLIGRAPEYANICEYNKY